MANKNQKDKMNILLVHNFYKIPGGEGTVVENESQMLKEKGNNVFLYTRNNNEIDNYNIFQKICLPLNYLFNLKTYLEIKKIIREKNIDIVHVHNTTNIISCSVYYACFRMRKPVVQTVHNYRLLCPNGLFYRNGKICEDCVNNDLRCAIKNNCYRNSKLQTLLSVINIKLQRKLKLYSKINYICLTEFNKNKLLSLSQIDEDRIYIKPNFSTHKGIIIPEEKRLNQIVFVGRLDEYKGIKFILEVFRKTNKKLIVVGTGELSDWCERYVKEHKMENIVLLGQKTHEETVGIMACSKALIFASNLYEGFPMTIVESLSCGTPVITSKLGNAGAIISEGISGYKYKHNSIEDCLNCIKKINNNVKIYKSTYKEYLDKFTENENYKQLMDIYKKCMTKL